MNVTIKEFSVGFVANSNLFSGSWVDWDSADEAFQWSGELVVKYHNIAVFGERGKSYANLGLLDGDSRQNLGGATFDNFIGGVRLYF